MDFQQAVAQERQSIEHSVRCLAREWTKFELSKGNDPTVDDFLNAHESFKESEVLVRAIGEEMFRVKNMETLEAFANEGIG